QAARAASAKNAPRRKLSWESSPAETAAPSATRRISARRFFGKAWLEWARSLLERCGGFSEMRTSAASMPSAEVPDMRPRTSMGLEVMKGSEKDSYHRDHRGHREWEGTGAQRVKAFVGGCICREEVTRARVDERERQEGN